MDIKCCITLSPACRASLPPHTSRYTCKNIYDVDPYGQQLEDKGNRFSLTIPIALYKGMTFQLTLNIITLQTFNPVNITLTCQKISVNSIFSKISFLKL